MTSKKVIRARQIQEFLEEEFGFYVDTYQLGEVEQIKRKLEEFLTLGVDTDDLKPMDEYTVEEMKEIGKRG